MGHTTQAKFKERKILSASEIGQYNFCSVAWYLQRCGYKPRSDLLEIGAKKHTELGNIVNSAQKHATASRLLATAGYLLIAVAILLILIEVMF